MARKWHFWPALETPEQAVQELAFTAKAVYAFAGFHLVVFTALYAVQGRFSEDFFDPVFMAAIALTMTHKRSRIAAATLAGYAFLMIFLTFLNRIGVPFEGSYGGRNIFLVVLFLYISLRALRAASIYHYLARTVIHWRRGWAIFGIACLYAFVITSTFFIMASVLLEGGITEDEELLFGGILVVTIIAVFFFAGWRKLPGTGRLAVVLPAPQVAKPRGEGENTSSAAALPTLDATFNASDDFAVTANLVVAEPSAISGVPAASYPMTKAGQPAEGYFIRHWRGELSLARSFWVNVVAINLAFAIPFVVLNALENQLSFRFVATAAAIFMTLILVLYVWQIVGCWRSAAAHVRRTGRQGWARAAQVALVLGALQTAFRSFPMTEEFIAIATGLDPNNNFTIERIGDTEIAVNGRLGINVSEDVRKILKTSSKIEWIHLNSAGGRTGAARELARIIEEHRLSTYTETGCASSCFIAFMAGNQRVLNTKARIGLHAYAMRGATDAIINQEIAKDREYLIKRGVLPDFLDTAFTTPNSKMWFPSLDELARAGVITHSFNGKTVTSVR